jgi:hypothetical protein
MDYVKDALIKINYFGLVMLRNLDIIKTIKRKIKLIAAVFQLYTLSSVLTLNYGELQEVENGTRNAVFRGKQTNISKSLASMVLSIDYYLMIYR